MTLHDATDVHLTDRSFPELIADNVDPTADRVLIISQSRGLKQATEEILGKKINGVEYTGDTHDLPFEENEFDATVLVNTTRDALHRHQPLYEAVDVTTHGGALIYKSPNYIAESNQVDFSTVLAENYISDDPAIVAIGEIIMTQQRFDQFSESDDDISDR